MSNAFKVVVTDAKGKVRVETAAVGGANLDEEGVKAHLEEHNVYPGARSIEVFPSDEKLPNKLEDLPAFVKRAQEKAKADKAARPVEADVTQAEAVPVQENPHMLERVTRSHLPDMTTMPGAVVRQTAKPASKPGEPAVLGSPNESKASPGVAPAKRPAGGPAQP